MTTTAAPQAMAGEVELPFDRGEGGQERLSTISTTWEPTSRAKVVFDNETACMAAWAVVLSRYAGHPSVVLGILTDEGLREARVEVDGALSFSALVADLGGAIESARPVDGLPVVFVPSDREIDDPSVPKSVLAVQVRSNPGEVRVRFSTARFEAVTAGRIAGHIANVLAMIEAQAAEVIIADLEVVTDEELARLAEWNSTRVERDDETLVSLFAAAVDRWPDDVAVVYDQRVLTYAELASAAVSVARELKKRGVGRGSMVGVLCERSVEMVTALYGTIAAGGAYVPLDPEYPANRISYMISETDMEVVIADAKFRHLIPEDSAVAVLDAQQSTTASPSGSDLRALCPNLSPDDVAYVIYTSGSTGRPKGVANSHRGVSNRLLWMQDHFRLDGDHVALQKTPFSFDVSVWEFFWPLQAGARLVVARPDGHRDPAYLIETINAHQVDTIHFVPSMLRLFLDHPAAGSCSSLARVICSGEALTRDLQDRFFEVLPNAELHNLYGPTEAAIDVTEWQCRPDDDLPVVPIGRPIANTTIDILDDLMRPVPIGVAAELYIGGVQVAVGYVNRPDLTDERFIPDPHRPGGRLYKTGDLARWLPNGTIDFLGRLDHQVKIRGQRIELGEIEATLGEHPSILEAAVTVDRRGSDANLIAHLMWRAEPASDATLRAFLADRLPAYMVPSRFVSHQALPLTTSGKVDRNALIDPAAEVLPEGAGGVGSDPLENLLLRIWRSVLGREDIGPHDRVFDLGATSLQAAAFVNEVQRFLGEFVYVVTVFTSPTVAEYAAFLRDQYPFALRGKLGGDVAVSAREDTKVNETMVSSMEGVVPRLGPFPLWASQPPNPQAAFILAPPRSGTTLLRVMLAGHSHIFAAPELQLLGFDDLSVRRSKLTGRFSPWLEGAIRAVMELENCDAQAAIDFIDRYEQESASSKEFFGILQELAGGRLLIDKSPAYALDLDVLRNAEAGFERPLYIHLVREPEAMSRSFESYHMDQILYLHDHDFSARTLGELVWTLSHQNILQFAQEVDDDRLVRIRFEDLVTEPGPVMEKVAAFLGVPFEESLLNPYDDLDAKMVDGLHAASTPMGDTRLLERDRIDPGAATKWSRPDSAPVLGDPTLRIARLLGYGTDHIEEKAARRRDYTATARQRRTRSREK